MAQTCKVTAEPRPDGAMDVTIRLEGVRAVHDRNCQFVLYDFRGKAPFRIKTAGVEMQPHMILKIFARPNAPKLARVRWAAQLKFAKREQFLLDEENRRLAGAPRRKYGH